MQTQEQIFEKLKTENTSPFEFFEFESGEKSWLLSAKAPSQPFNFLLTYMESLGKTGRSIFSSDQDGVLAVSLARRIAEKDSSEYEDLMRADFDFINSLIKDRDDDELEDDDD